MGAMIGLILFLALAVYRILPLVLAINKETDNLRKKIAETNKNIAELEESKKYLQDPAYLERQARIRLNYKKPNEKVVFVYQSPYNQNPGMKTDEAKGLFRKLKQWFAELIGK